MVVRKGDFDFPVVGVGTCISERLLSLRTFLLSWELTRAILVHV